MPDSQRLVGARGEGTIEFQGQTLPVLLTNRAIAEAEKATGKTMIQLAQAGSTGNIGMNDIVQLLRAGLEYGRRDAGIQRQVYSVDDAYNVLDALGFAPCAKVVILALSDVLSYRGDDADSKRSDAVPPVVARSET